MSSRFSLAPNLTPDEKIRLRRWLEVTLENPRLVNSNRWPLNNSRIGIYCDGSSRGIVGGTWQNDGSYYLYVGVESAGYPLTDRLAVLACIITAADLWEPLLEKFSTAVSKVMLESYNEVMQGLVASRGGVRATGLAFSADRQQVAARMGDEGYFLPNGQPVEIDDTWTLAN
jgi:hypothetical protein